MSDESNIEGTFECPICGHNEPHGHNEAEQIRWHKQYRPTFEALVYKKMRHSNGVTYIGNLQIHEGHRMGYEGHRARGEREWAQLTQTGGYVRPWMQTLWEMYQSTILSAPSVPRTYPEEMTEELKLALGRPNFLCGPIARIFREAGSVIESRAEAEQAFVIHWMVKLVLDHGKDWVDSAQDQLSLMRVLAREKRINEQS